MEGSVFLCNLEILLGDRSVLSTLFKLDGILQNDTLEYVPVFPGDLTRVRKKRSTGIHMILHIMFSQELIEYEAASGGVPKQRA